MQSVESFVAGALLKRLQSPDEPARATAVTFRGAVLVADISGYTELAETMCAKGAEGVEQLGQTLNHALGDYVRVMRETAGEIACFAGDAFIAYWPADDANVPRALRKAHDAARALHAVSRGAPGSTEPVPTLHIGIGAGDIWAARLGGEGHWQLLLAGPAVRQACAATARAARGTTIIAPEAGPFVAPEPDVLHVDHDPRPGESHEHESSRLDLSGLVPSHLSEYLNHGCGSWIPQRRAICALFATIRGIDERAVDALSRHQDVVRSLQLALRPYTAEPGTLLLDDKGLVFTICFGMPHDAHADDAVRAVRAGLAIRSELARLGLESSVGIASGQGVCMPLGGPERSHYWSVGRFMHLASRLTDAAGDGILCSKEVGDRVLHIVTLSPLRLTLKGLAGQTRAYRIGEAVTFDDPTGHLHGREEEQARLDRYLDAFEDGRGAVLAIVGDAGLGKTALVDYLRQSAEQRKIAWLSGAAGSAGVATAYRAWRPVFRELLGARHTAPFASVAEREEWLGAKRYRPLAPLVNVVVPGFLQETPLVQALTGQARADATLDVLSEVLEAHATNRFVLILEDCHWMDSASWRLLVRIAQEHPQALIVLTWRPAEMPHAQALRALPGFAEMTLAPLAGDATVRLVRSLLAGRPEAPGLADDIAKRSGGNPLYAREYVLLLTSDVEPPPGDSPHATPGMGLTVDVDRDPKDPIERRLDALPAVERVALSTASVIGDTFSGDRVARVYPGSQDAHAIEELLNRLSERQLLAKDPADGRRFVFRHALIREVTYRHLTGEQRRALHRRVAEALEREYQDEVASHAATLAHHWSRAEVAEAAIRYSDLAASQALAAGVFDQAEQFLNRCLEVATDSAMPVETATKIRWHRQLADARHGKGLLEPRRDAARRAIRLAGLVRPHAPAVLLAQAAVRVCRLALHRPARLPRGTDAEAIMDVARAFRHCAEVCYFSDDMIGMICDCVGAVAFARALPASPVLAGAAAELGGILTIAGLRQKGEQILGRAIAIAEQADDRDAQAYAHMVSCLHRVGRGEWEAAEVSARRCQELCERMDARVNWTNAQAVRFWMNHYRSHDAAAYDAARRLHDRATETGNRQHRAWGHRFLAICALRRGDPRDAVVQAKAALEFLGETAVLNERIPTLGLLALAQLRTGATEAARATARDADALVATVKWPIGQSTLEGYSSLLTVALDAWRDDPQDWRTRVARCFRVLDRYRRAFPVGQARYHLHYGDYSRLRGKYRAARRCYMAGEAAAHRLGMPWEVRRCQQALAELSGTSR